MPSAAVGRGARVGDGLARAGAGPRGPSPWAASARSSALAAASRPGAPASSACTTRLRPRRRAASAAPRRAPARCARPRWRRSARRSGTARARPGSARSAQHVGRDHAGHEAQAHLGEARAACRRRRRRCRRRPRGPRRRRAPRRGCAPPPASAQRSRASKACCERGGVGEVLLERVARGRAPHPRRGRRPRRRRSPSPPSTTTRTSSCATGAWKASASARGQVLVEGVALLGAVAGARRATRALDVDHAPSWPRRSRATSGRRPTHRLGAGALRLAARASPSTVARLRRDR